MTSPLRWRLTAAARAAVALVACSALLGGCGRESGQATGEPAVSSPGGDSSSTGAASARQVAIVTVTAAGGEVASSPTPLPTSASVTAYVGRFDNRLMARRIRAVHRTTELPPEQTLVAAVVAVGCEVPTEVSILGPPGDLRIDAVLDLRSPKECFAPMTSVALVAVGNDLLAG